MRRGTLSASLHNTHEGGQAETGRAAGEFPALYGQALSLMQQGRWQEADAALGALEGSYPGTAEVAEARLRLALHLSAEESWVGDPREVKKPSGAFAIRALLVANAVLYLLVALVWLLSRLLGAA